MPCLIDEKDSKSEFSAELLSQVLFDDFVVLNLDLPEAIIENGSGSPDIRWFPQVVKPIRVNRFEVLGLLRKLSKAYREILISRC